MRKLEDRLKELVDELCDGKPTVFAKKAGIPPSTFQYYIKGRPPHSDHLSRICEFYNVNINWLLIEKGPKYLQGGDQDETTPESVTDVVNVQELLNMTAEVLVSSTIYRPALAANIKAFHRSIALEQDNKELKNRVEKIEARLLDLENEQTSIAPEKNKPASQKKPANQRSGEENQQR